MIKLRQTFVRLLKLKNVNYAFSKKNRNLSYSTKKCYSFHTYCTNSTIPRSLENEYMYQIVSKNVLPLYPFNKNVENITTIENFESILNRNYKLDSGYSASDILNAFKSVQNYCSMNNITLADVRFNNLVDGLMDHCENLTDDELLELLVCLSHYPSCKSYQDHNFHDIWSCLNDMSCAKIPDRDLEYLFKLADAWYKLHLGKIGEFIFSFLDKCSRKAKHLSKDQLVEVFFFTNVCRRKVIAFEFEEIVEKYLPQLSVEELGVIALGYFKSMSKIKLANICLAMMDAVKTHASTINPITLTSILKALRFSKPTTLMKELDEMLDTLLPQIDRLPPQCCLHISIIGSSLMHLHKSTMEKSTQKLVNIMQNIDDVRLKDLERIVSAASMVDFRPNVTPDLFQTVFNEIHKDQRLGELGRFPKILPCILNYLSIVNMYSYELIDRVLDPSYISETYAQGFGTIPRDIFSLDCCIDIECPDYVGNRLSPNMKYRLVKWLLEFTPSYGQYTKLKAYDKLYLDVVDKLKMTIGDETVVRPDHVAPHFPRADIILCKDITTKKFIEPPGFQRYVLGDLKYAMADSNLSWYAITVVGWNNTVRGTSKPVGLVVMKQRHLRKLGYSPKLIIWNEYMNLSKLGKIEYLKSLLR